MLKTETIIYKETVFIVNVAILLQGMTVSCGRTTTHKARAAGLVWYFPNTLMSQRDILFSTVPQLWYITALEETDQ